MGEERITRMGNSKVHVVFVAGSDEVDAVIKDAESVVADLKKRPLDDRQKGLRPEEAEVNAIATQATRAIVENAIRKSVEQNGFRLISHPEVTVDRLVVAGQPYSFSSVLDIVPEFKLREYENLKIRVSHNLEVTTADINARLEIIRLRAASIRKDSNDPITDHDVVELTFQSYIGGASYDGSTAEGYSYTMGSKVLPRGFEEGLRGLRAGERKTIEFTIPANYKNEEIAGETARFEVLVKRVTACILPDVDDKLARLFGYSDLRAWVTKLSVDLAREKARDYRMACEKAAREALADRLMGVVDEGVIDDHAANMFEAFRLDLARQGTSLEEYCRFFGLTEGSIRQEMKEESCTLVRENLALESLFRSLGMSITEKDVQDTIGKLAKDNAIEEFPTADEFSIDQRAALQEMTMHRMATEWLMDHVEFIE